MNPGGQAGTTAIDAATEQCACPEADYGIETNPNGERLKFRLAGRLAAQQGIATRAARAILTSRTNVMNGPAVSTPVMAGALAVRFRCEKALVLAVLPLVWTACDSGTSDEQGAGSALCPNGSFTDLGTDTCAHCAGLACDPTDHCERTHTQGVTDCTCHAGHMVCCSSGLPPASGSCDYGGLPAPTCPASKPESAAPCEGPQICSYKDPCCDFPIVAQCNTAWVMVNESYCSTQHPIRCTDAGPDAPPDSSATDAADAGD